MRARKLDPRAVQSFARMVRRSFAGRGAHYDLDDVEQDAALAVLETHADKGFPLEGHRGYYFRAASCEAGLAMARRIACVSVSEYAVGGFGTWGKGNGGWAWGGRRDPHGYDCDDELERALTAEQRADDVSRRAEREAGEERLMGILADRIDGLPRRDRRPLRLMLGIGREPVEPARAARISRRTRAAVAMSARRLKAAVAADREAAEARRVTIGR